MSSPSGLEGAKDKSKGAIQSVGRQSIESLTASLREVEEELSKVDAYNDGRTDEEILKGWTTAQAEDQLKKYGYNEVVTPDDPEWKKIVSRFLGLVPLLLPRPAPAGAAPPDPHPHPAPLSRRSQDKDKIGSGEIGNL